MLETLTCVIAAGNLPVSFLNCKCCGAHGSVADFCLRAGVVAPE